MRNSNLVIIILLSVLAGYFAYPYFNQSQQSLGAKVNSDTQIKNEQLPSRPIKKVSVTEDTSEDILTDTTTTEQTDLDLENSTEAIAPNSSVQNSDGSNEGKSDSEPTSSSVGNSNRTQTLRDFSFYKLSKLPDRIAISNNDPRITFMKGTYRGFYEGSSVELIVTRKESSIDFSNNRELSYAATTDLFFTNVNDNGNLLLIDSGKNKIFVDISKWPLIELNLGLNTKIILR